MAFFVVQRGAESALSVPLPQAYPTREAALAALSAAAGEGSIDLGGELFIADLSAAVPVLMVPTGNQAANPQRVEAPEAEGAEVGAPAADDPPVAEEILVEAPESEWSALAGFGDDESLAAALKRAANSLEDEGIVAPASIESAPEGEVADEIEEPAGDEPTESWPWANVEVYTPAEDEEPDLSEELDEPETFGAPAGDLQADAGIDVPRQDTGLGAAVVSEPLGVSIDAEATGDESADMDADATDLSDELYGLTGALTDPLGAESPIITGAPADGEEAYMPRPVILGDYADATPILGEADALAGPPAEIYEAIVAETLQDLPVVDPSPGADGGYEVAGELDLDEYTCQDCVYANTCPKVGQATPADCGSFQWRAE